MTVPPDVIVKVSNECGKMLDDLLRHKGISFVLTICNDDPAGSFAHWFSNTKKENAINMLRKTLEQIEKRDKPTNEE